MTGACAVLTILLPRFPVWVFYNKKAAAARQRQHDVLDESVVAKG